ncbi:MAG: aminoglycoside phosphotransferase family protein [Myxococcota bacterium]
MAVAIPSGLEERLRALYPGATVTRVEALAPDSGADETEKRIGYGQPLRVVLRDAEGATRQLIFHVERPNDFGHDRRADRAADILLAWDSFNLVPHHTRAVDVGAITADGRLLPLGEAGELYLLTEWAEGDVYAADLRRVAKEGRVEPLDVQRVEALAEVLLEIHRAPLDGRPAAYTRALRDLVGSGEGIAGIVDGYGRGAPGASAERLAALEARCLAWRQRLKHRGERLRRTHGDFHPFNIVFAPGAAVPTLLDTSRGSLGDPADDVTCLAINFLFFGLEHRDQWSAGLGELWRRFWRTYLAEGDAGVLEVAAPFFAWRALVVCNPQWYPHLSAEDRDRMLRFAERVLDAPRFEPAWGEEAMR